MIKMITEKHEITRLKFCILSLIPQDISEFACIMAESVGKNPAGYGVYNLRINAENGKRYIQWERLSSCD